MYIGFILIFLITWSGLALQQTPLQVLKEEQNNPQSRLWHRTIPFDVNNEITKFVSPLEYHGPPSPDNTTFDYGPLKFVLQADTNDDRILKITYDEKKEYLKGGKLYQSDSLQLTDLLLTRIGGHIEFQCFYEVDLDVSQGRRVLLTFSALLPSIVDFSTARLVSSHKPETKMFKLKGNEVLMDPAALDADTIQIVPADAQTVVAFSPKGGSAVAASP